MSTIIIDGVEHLVNDDTAAAIERLQRDNADMRVALDNLARLFAQHVRDAEKWFTYREACAVVKKGGAK